MSLITFSVVFYSYFINLKLMYFCSYDEVNYLSQSQIRPRARKLLEWKNMNSCDCAMVNYNIDKPTNRGFWYDAVILEKVRGIWNLYSFSKCTWNFFWKSSALKCICYVLRAVFQISGLTWHDLASFDSCSQGLEWKTFFPFHLKIFFHFPSYNVLAHDWKILWFFIKILDWVELPRCEYKSYIQIKRCPLSQEIRKRPRSCW